MNEEPVNLSSKVISGAKWSTVSQVARQVLGFLNKIILANLLPPGAFGLLGMATVVIGFLGIFKDIGTASSLIQHKNLTDTLLSSVFWLNVLFGVVVTGVLIALAPLAAVFFHEPQVTPVMRVLSFSFLLSSFSIVQQALLSRQMAFKALTRIEITSVIIATIIGISMALAGAGVWSLVAASLATATVSTILLWVRSSWRPQMAMNWQDIRSIASYSLNLSGFNVFSYFTRNADNLLIGRYLGATSLGFYSMAYNIMLYPLQNISRVLGRVLFPAFAHIQDDHARFRRAYLRLCATIAVITFPVMLGLFVTADLLIEVLLGETWMPVALLLIILAPVGMVQSISTTVGHIYTTKGRTDWMFRWVVIAGMLIVGSFAIGLQWGIIGVAIAYTVVYFLILYPNFAIPFKLIELPVIELVRVLWPIFKYALEMAAVVLVVRMVGAWWGSADLPLLAACILVGMGTYTALMLYNKSPVVREIASLFPLHHIPVLYRMAMHFKLTER